MKRHDILQQQHDTCVKNIYMFDVPPNNKKMSLQFCSFKSHSGATYAHRTYTIYISLIDPNVFLHEDYVGVCADRLLMEVRQDSTSSWG
mmetsp:Transcript_36978/g.110751  ORF Transcript_36978/g.110751 Transcript_36978/m.110751 type:complete len:89 (+) Transcript_36978:647-913(+)